MFRLVGARWTWPCARTAPGDTVLSGWYAATMAPAARVVTPFPSANEWTDVDHVPVDEVDLVLDRGRGRGRQRGRDGGRKVAREPGSAFGIDVDAQPSRVLASGGMETGTVASLERKPGRHVSVERRGSASGPALEHGRLHRGTTRGLDRKPELAVLPGRDDAADQGRALARTATDHGSIRTALPDTCDRRATFPVNKRGLAGTPEPAIGGELGFRAVGSIDVQSARRLPSRECRRGCWQCGRRDPAADDCTDQSHPPLRFFKLRFHPVPPSLESTVEPQGQGGCQACSRRSPHRGAVRRRTTSP